MARAGTTLGEEETVLIAAKTYPTPSKGYVETTCVAAISDSGRLRRVFPVSFRLLRDDQQFAKWQWVTARFRSPNDDHRPESRRIDVDSMVLGDKIPTKGDWRERLAWVEPHIVPSYAALEERRRATGETLGFLRPSRLLGLDITPLPPAERDWSDEERAKLTRDQEQGDLFAADADAEKAPYPRRVLEKLPFKFHYRYEIDTPHGPETLRHMITDWEAGVLYRNCLRSHGTGWEEPFRARLETEFKEKDLVFMMGTQHRFPDQWLIISLIYPSRGGTKMAAQKVMEVMQPSLEL